MSYGGIPCLCAHLASRTAFNCLKAFFDLLTIKNEVPIPIRDVFRKIDLSSYKSIAVDIYKVGVQHRWTIIVILPKSNVTGLLSEVCSPPNELSIYQCMRSTGFDGMVTGTYHRRLQGPRSDPWLHFPIVGPSFEVGRAGYSHYKDGH